MTTKNFKIVIVLSFVLASWLCSSCEETLESCSSCGLLSQGDTNIAGEPRIDGTFEAAYQIGLKSEKSINEFDETVSALAVEYGVDLPEDSAITKEKVEELVGRIEQDLLDLTWLSTSFGLSFGRCFGDNELALRRQLLCEDRNELGVLPGCSEEQQGSCTGMCIGKCLDPNGSVNICTGSCYMDVDIAQDSCLGGCKGACSQEDEIPCPGTCFGDCASQCTAYSDDGKCAGICAGLCKGICESEYQVDCGGVCIGECRVAVLDGSGCQGTCEGDCSNGLCTRGSRCLGHFRPKGCTTSEATREVAFGCQEASRLLAWTYMRCGPSSVEVGFKTGTEQQLAETKSIKRLLNLKRSIDALLENFVWISILVDGVDPSGNLTPSALTEDYDGEYFLPPAGKLTLSDLGEYGYVEKRGHLPMEALKARLGMLLNEVDKGDYKIAAGALSCVGPALQEAWTIIDDLIPAVAVDEQGDGVADYYLEDRTRGLYRVLDGTKVFLSLVGWVQEGSK